MLQGRLEASRLGIGSRDGVRGEGTATEPLLLSGEEGGKLGDLVFLALDLARVQEETKHGEFLHVDCGRVVRNPEVIRREPAIRDACKVDPNRIDDNQRDRREVRYQAHGVRIAFCRSTNAQPRG